MAADDSRKAAKGIKYTILVLGAKNDQCCKEFQQIDIDNTAAN